MAGFVDCQYRPERLLQPRPRRHRVLYKLPSGDVTRTETVKHALAAANRANTSVKKTFGPVSAMAMYQSSTTSSLPVEVAQSLAKSARVRTVRPARREGRGTFLFVSRIRVSARCWR